MSIKVNVRVSHKPRPIFITPEECHRNTRKSLKNYDCNHNYNPDHITNIDNSNKNKNKNNIINNSWNNYHNDNKYKHNGDKLYDFSLSYHNHEW